MYIGVIESHTVLMAVFVDDVLLASTCEDVTVHVKSLFHAQFRIRDMGPASEFLNIRITQRPGVISIDQEPYVNSILAKYPMYIGTRNNADVPSMTEYIHRDDTPTSPKQLKYVSVYPYAEIVGSLLYLAVVSRPDISYAVGVLTRHLKCPTYASCKAASRVLNYLSQHSAVCIRYSGSSLDLHVYSDSDWGSDKDTRRSTSGVLIMMAGGPVN